MLFIDVVSIKESSCCEKCASFEYDLPCKIDKVILEELVLFLNSSEKPMTINANEDLLKTNKLFNSNTPIKITKDENTKIELKPNRRWLKLCVSKEDNNTKQKVEMKLAEWISSTLKIEIEL